MKIAQIKNDLVNWRKLSLGKDFKVYKFYCWFNHTHLYALHSFSFRILLSIRSLKDRITKAFTEAYPEYSIQLGDMHYNFGRIV